MFKIILILAVAFLLLKLVWGKYEHEIQCFLYDLNTKFTRKKRK